MTAPIYKRQEMVSVKFIAEKWGMGLSTVYRLIESGQLPAFQFGGRLRVHINTLAEFEESSRL